MSKDYTINQAAKILGVHRETIKYWEENGLIPKARRNPRNSYRVYNLQELKEIAKIRGIHGIDFESIS